MLAENKFLSNKLLRKPHFPQKQPEATNLKAKTVSLPAATCSDCTQGPKQIFLLKIYIIE